MRAVRRWWPDVSGSVADLGVLVPLVAVLTTRNGLDAATVLVGFGILYIASGLYLRLPVPVQPIKAAAAVAIARDLPAGTIGAAGFVLGAILTLVAITGLAPRMERLFDRPIVRGLQLGVGLILLRSAVSLAGSSTSLLIAGAVAAILVLGARRHRPLPLMLPLIVAGVAASALAGHVPHLELGPWMPAVSAGVFDATVLMSALILLVVPQLPLTLGNAVVGVAELEHRYYPEIAERATPRRFALSSGIANMIGGVLGALPMCHGSGGLTAHFRAGAVSLRMNLFIGTALLGAGFFLGPAALAILGLIPAPVLAGSLAFTGGFHASLAASLRGRDLVSAVTIGMVGLVTMNLALGLVLGLCVHRLPLGSRRHDPAAQGA